MKKYSSRRFFFKKPVRSIVQLFFLVVFVFLVRVLWGAAGAHNLCPWALVEVPALMLSLKVGIFFVGGVILGIIGIAATLFYPRPFCGWVCPLGTLFDFLGDLGKKIGFSAKQIPHWLNEKLRFFSYGVLGILVVMTFLTKRLVCIYGCPAFWICSAGRIAVPIITIVILAAVFILSLRVKRGFCRYICPYGALTALFVPLSMKKVRGNLEVCISCRICSKACPMGIDFLHDFDVNSAHCISCGECIDSCPKRTLFWGNRRDS